MNIHWFLDKVKLTGSAYQAINGALLTSVFFFCRIVWGGYNSYYTFADMYTAWKSGLIGTPYVSIAPDMTLADAEVMAFAGSRSLPFWVAGAYLGSNIVLNILNYYWFGKMVSTIRARFDAPWGTKGLGNDSKPVSKANPKPQEPAQVFNTRAGALLNPNLASGAAPTSDDKILQDAERLHQQGKGSVSAARLKAEQALLAEPTVERATTPDGMQSLEVTGSARKSARNRRKA